MTEINVFNKTQQIIVDPPSSSVSVVHGGPVGPAGPQGIQGIQGVQGPEGSVSSADILPFQELVNMMMNERIGRAVGNAHVVTSASFINVNLTPSDATDFLKVRADTSIFVTLNISCYHSLAGKISEWGFSLSGTDYFCGPMSNNDASVHQAVSFFYEVTGKGIGTHAFRPRVRYPASNASGSVTVDFNDPFSWHIREVLR